MKEVMAFIRVNKVQATKEALAKNGFPAFTCRKCLGRGKKSIDSMLLDTLLSVGKLPVNEVGEHLTETSRLISKRFFTLIVDDSDIKKVVDTIVGANQTGNPGDGRIFILPIYESYTIRNGENTKEMY